MPIPLGVLAVAGAGAGPVPGGPAYELLETEILTGSQSSITFDNLNSTYGSTYQHLQLRMLLRSNRANVYDLGRLRFNTDDGSNYATHYMIGTGSTVISDAETSQTSIKLYRAIVGGNASANVFGTGIFDILDAFETTKYTTVRGLEGHLIPSNDQRLQLTSGLWMNTAALTDITIDSSFGANLVSGTRVSLYGLRSA